jgi:hypothetical protein
MRSASLILILALTSPLTFAGLPSEPKPEADGNALPPAAIATVNGRMITLAAFDQMLAAAVRSRFYHRAPPEGQLAAVRREVADGMVDLALVAQEARKRGIAADAAQVEGALEQIEARFKAMPGWAEHRAAQRAIWRSDLEERALAQALEKHVRAATVLGEADARAFYDANPALFTEPEKLRVELILLKVDPSAPKAARDKAREEAAAIRERLAKGADFAQLARIHSADATAARGGDMGYVHRGMLPEPVQAVVDSLEGERVSEPVAVLEGIAILRVPDRKPGSLRAFADVRERAAELLRRDRAEASWKSFVAKLRAEANIKFDPVRYPALARAENDAPKEPPGR